MMPLQNAPLRQKLTWLAMACSILALLTMALALGVYEWAIYRRTTFTHLETVSLLTARTSVNALAFENDEDAQRLLTALEAEPAVTVAALYDENGGKVAEYRKPGTGASTPVTAPADGIARRGSLLDIAVPVGESRRVGTLLLRADVSVIAERLVVYGVLLLAVAALAGMLAFLLSGWLSERIIAPVQALVNAASGVKTKSDYSVRVAKVEDDELGVLTDAFNDMLARVEENENKLYRGNERLRLALQAAKIGTWDWNLVRDEMLWNERNYEIFGVTPGMPVNSALFFGLVHPDDRVQVRTAVEAAAHAGKDFSAEFRLSRPEKPARHVIARGMFLKSSAGDPLRAVGVTMDVTERRRGELRVAESEKRFRAVAERAPVLIWSCDQALNRDYFNRTWLQFTGRKMEEEAGTGWQDGVPDVDLMRWREMVSTAATELNPYSIEYRLRRHDGELRWVIESGSPRQAADGAFAGYLGSCIDITARKENEAELEAHVQRRTRELEVANQELESFSYSVSHDLRSPVRAIQGFAEIALEECQANDPKSAAERLQRVLKAADRMNKLIDAFISMARISRAELTIATVNLTKIAEEVVGFLRSANPERQVEVTIAPGIEAHCDERLIRIVIENLLSNAWKFTSRREEARIEFGGMRRESEQVVFVRDNGAGFSPARAHKLFQAFERLHHGAQFEGLGVGLSTVHRVIEKHHGRVWAEGAEDKGATFYFSVPDVKAPIGRAPASTSSPFGTSEIRLA